MFKGKQPSQVEIAAVEDSGPQVGLPRAFVQGAVYGLGFGLSLPAVLWVLPTNQGVATTKLRVKRVPGIGRCASRFNHWPKQPPGSKGF